MKRLSLIDRIKSSIFIDKNDCWNWIKKKHHKEKYGQITINRTTKLAHRVSYEVFVSANINGKLIRHRCHNRACVNPKHLIAGSVKQNADDRRRDWKLFIAANPNQHRNFLEAKKKLDDAFRGWVNSP